MATITYQYGIDENGKRMHISEVDIATHRGRVFKCISCGGELIAKIGDSGKARTKSSHFAHKHVCECNYESYLHKLGKSLFIELFNSEKPINLRVPTIKVCPEKDSCPLHDASKCMIEKDMEVNLKNFYDTCTEEKEYDGFRADLLLESKKHPDTPPIFIEIVYTHKSTPQKINSTNKIIEIDVHDEDQLRSVMRITFSENIYIRLYNFERKITGEWDGIYERYLNHFLLFEGGAVIANPNCRLTSCKKRNIANPSALVEFLFETNDPELRWTSPYTIGFYLAKKAGYSVKNCGLCKYHIIKDPFFTGNDQLCCNLHNKFGTPEHPDWTEARTCHYFREDKEMMNQIEQRINSITYMQIK